MLDLTVLILTWNERENIRRTLEALSWAERVLVVDSFSTDETIGIASAFRNVVVIQHSFESFALQCNFGLKQISTEWVLSLDADYVLTPELSREIQAVSEEREIAGYFVAFNYNVFGRRLCSTIYPPRAVLYRRTAAVYEDEGHGHRVRITGGVRTLRGRIDHDDRKPLSRWIESQDRYAQIEAAHLLRTQTRALTVQDRMRRKLFIAPPAMFLYLLFGRGVILNGWPGWYYVLQRTIAEMLLSLRLLTIRHRLESAD